MAWTVLAPSINTNQTATSPLGHHDDNGAAPCLAPAPQESNWCHGRAPHLIAYPAVASNLAQTNQALFVRRWRAHIECGNLSHVFLGISSWDYLLPLLLPYVFCAYLR